MAEFIVDSIKWKKGELGYQTIHLYESDGQTKRDGTGKSYKFTFWKKGYDSLKGEANLTSVAPHDGEHTFRVIESFTDTVGEFRGEIIEDPDGDKLRSETFVVKVEQSSEGLSVE